MRYLWIILLILATFLTACSRRAAPGGAPEVLVTRIFITTTPQPTQPPSPTPTATHSPTPTPTPTPTAPAMTVTGNPRAYTLFDPVTQPGAPCGWADTLDFPLDPPNGEGAFGGGDFGVYRSRYDKYHAGEDWGLASRSNFGQPVHSIGHGQVTYAQPLGWGADKGVVIVRHTFPDGDTFLSFYGHLDPPSVTLREGECVLRGDIVGQIGRPRTPPHLHFEVRVHLPYSTGGGYWPSDPTGAGWLPPSKTVNQVRLQLSPGTVWSQSGSSNRSLPLGIFDDTLFLTIDDQVLVASDLLTGEPIWSYALPGYIKDALLDSARGLLYVVASGAGLLVYDLPAGEVEALPDELEPLREQGLSPSGRVDLMPLPDGGVLVGYKDTLSAFSPQGDLLWEEAEDGYLVSWALAEELLVLTTSDPDAPLKTADAEGLQTWDSVLTGMPLVSGDQVWFYATDGLYRLNLNAQTARRMYLLPPALTRRSTALPLPDGGLLLLHADTADRRLISFDAQGELRWEFSVPFYGNATLFEADGEIYLLQQPTVSGQRTYKTVEVFAVGPAQAQLFRLFEGSSRTFDPGATWAFSLDEIGLLINIGGGGRILLDPRAALQRMGQ